MAGINRYPLLTREDLQMVAMVDDARERLKELGIDMDKKIFIEGYSASAMFTSRFTILHPDRVQAAAFGEHGWAIVPTERWEDLSLPYPYGTGDIETLTGEPFNLDEFKLLFSHTWAKKMIMGGRFPGIGGQVTIQAAITHASKKIFGSSAQEMSDSANEIYQALECSATFVIYKNQDHMSAYSHESDILKFFQEHK